MGNIWECSLEVVFFSASKLELLTVSLRRTSVFTMATAASSRVALGCHDEGLGDEPVSDNSHLFNLKSHEISTNETVMTLGYTRMDLMLYVDWCLLIVCRLRHRFTSFTPVFISSLPMFGSELAVNWHAMKF